MGHLHEAWRSSQGTANGCAAPVDRAAAKAAEAEYARREYERLQQQLADARAARAARAMCLEKAQQVFGEQVTLYAPLHPWVLEGSITRWRVTRGRDTVGFVAEFEDHVEAWSASEGKPGQLIG